MRKLVEDLCSDECAGRRAGSPGGAIARRLVVDALRDAGLDPFEQAVPSCGGANVLATIPGDDDRWIVIGAHHDHLGAAGGGIYHGADDNAAAVAILVDVAKRAAQSRNGRGVLIAAFDAEEPPYFLTGGMGSQHFVRHPTVPLDRIDMMVCMDLVGHRLGDPRLGDDVGQSLFALGAERSTGTSAHVRGIARAEPGVIVRPVDADVIPPLSDYDPFWRASVPFLFLSSGRSRVYHTPEDTPSMLDFAKMEATSRWLARFVDDTRRREDVRWVDDAQDDVGTLDTILSVLDALRAHSAEAEMAVAYASSLREACDRTGRLPDARRQEIAALVERVESGLA